jgi:hypothetical protein
MCRLRIILVLQIALVSLVGPEAFASQFVVFPEATELVSPDGRFAVRSVDSQGPASEIVGTFRTLWLFELATGRSRSSAIILESHPSPGPAMTGCLLRSMSAGGRPEPWFFP